MTKGILSISNLVDKRPKVICTLSVKGDTLEEISKDAVKKAEEFAQRNKDIVVYDISVKITLWI